MTKLIKGTYQGGFVPDLIGEVRWLDPTSGKAYRDSAGLNCQWVFKEKVNGVWFDGKRFFRPDAPTAPDCPAPDQAFKADGGKPNWFLLMSGKGCAAALAGVVRVLSFAVRPVAGGGKGYTEHSWRQVPNARERYEAALYRHLNKIALGELVDDESGESHWDHVATNALFLSELTKAGK